MSDSTMAEDFLTSHEYIWVQQSTGNPMRLVFQPSITISNISRTFFSISTGDRLR